MNRRVALRSCQQKKDKETLKEFVDGAAALVVGFLAARKGTAAREAASSNSVCLSQEPWAEGSIYLFFMEGNTVINNGNDPGLNGYVFEDVFDEDENDIWKLIKEAVGSEDGGGFIKYKWDNPLITEDDVKPREPGKSPGTSPKITYVTKRDFEGVYLVFGSGIYPPPTAESDDDGGCAVARPGDTSPGLLLNLLLMASVLFPAAFLRRGR